LPRIHGREPVERRVEVEEIDREHVYFDGGAIVAQKAFARSTASSFGGRTPARPVDEHAAHRLRGRAEEVRAAAARHLRIVDQAHVRFVDQIRRLKRDVAVLACELAMRHVVKLIVDERHEMVERSAIGGAGSRDVLEQGGRSRAAGKVGAHGSAPGGIRAAYGVSAAPDVKAHPFQLAPSGRSRFRLPRDASLRTR
jgi:hypothetical protein